MSEKLMLLIDGVKYSLWNPKNEEELEKSVKFHSENIFGSESIYFDIKKKIKTVTGKSTIPDAYLIDFEKKAFYIIEIELSIHPEYDHISKQIGKFISALKDYRTRQKIARILKDYIDKDIIRQKFVLNKIGNRELYQFFLEDILENVKEQNYHTIIIIDKITEKISEACNILIQRPKILEFKTFIRENVGDLRVHCHLFESLVPEKIDKTYKPDIPETKIHTKLIHVSFTGKKPEKAKLFNETFEVNNWRKLLLIVAEKLLKYNPEEFNNLADSGIMKGRKAYLLTKNKRLLRAPHQLSNGLFIETNLNSNSIVRIIKNRLLKGCGHKETDLEIFLKN